MSKLIRIDDSDFIKLQKLANEAAKKPKEIITLAIEEYARKVFANKTKKAYAKLKSNSKNWQDELNEREEWLSFNSLIDDD